MSIVDERIEVTEVPRCGYNRSGQSWTPRSYFRPIFFESILEA